MFCNSHKSSKTSVEWVIEERRGTFIWETFHCGCVSWTTLVRNISLEWVIQERLWSMSECSLFLILLTSTIKSFVCFSVFNEFEIKSINIISGIVLNDFLNNYSVTPEPPMLSNSQVTSELAVEDTVTNNYNFPWFILLKAWKKFHVSFIFTFLVTFIGFGPQIRIYIPYI